MISGSLSPPFSRSDTKESTILGNSLAKPISVMNKKPSENSQYNIIVQVLYKIWQLTMANPRYKSSQNVKQLTEQIPRGDPWIKQQLTCKNKDLRFIGSSCQTIEHQKKRTEKRNSQPLVNQVQSYLIVIVGCNRLSPYFLFNMESKARLNSCFSR